MVKLIALFIVLVFLSGCVDYQEAESETGLSELQTGLSELQITACNAADEGGTCNTKLERLGIVTKEDCCKTLGKCC